MKRLLLPLVACGLLMQPLGVQAGNLPAGSVDNNYLGNTQPQTTAVGEDGTVNFAVIFNSAPTAASWAALLGFSPTFTGINSTAFDPTVHFLYVYQPVNNLPGTTGTNTVSITVNPALITSLGDLSGVSLKDNLGNVSTSNMFGSDVINPTDAGISVANKGVNTPAIVSGVSGLVDPNSFSSTASSLIANYFTIVPPAGDLLPSGSVGSVWGFTSDKPPTYLFTSIQDGGVAANGRVPSPTTQPSDFNPAPTPSSFILFGIGLFCGVNLWRRQKAVLQLS